MTKQTLTNLGRALGTSATRAASSVVRAAGVLAKASAQVAADNFNRRVDASMGGQIAAQIRASRAQQSQSQSARQ